MDNLEFLQTIKGRLQNIIHRIERINVGNISHHISVTKKIVENLIISINEILKVRR